jgi:flagellar biosynthesis protein FlhB
VLHSLGVLAQRLGTGLAIVMLSLGLADYVWQLILHRHRMRMTQDEDRRDRKESEGAPEFKEERRSIHRALSAGIGDTALVGCALVVSEPGRLAVALFYSGAVEDVPVVLAKGERRSARCVEDLARAAAVPIIEDPRLAAALALLGEGREIPESLYHVVATMVVRARGMH